MGILPHTDVERALDLALSLELPFWPQLPRVSYFEDMYVQALDHFPGVLFNPKEQRIFFDLSRFYEEIPATLENEKDPQTFRLTEVFSLVYHRFLEKDLSHYPAIRGQMISPISLGLKVVDENQKPIIYHDEVKEILFDFIRNKVNQQLRELRRKHPKAFVWVDDPGLGLIFTAFSGYNEAQAKTDLDQFLLGLEGPRGIHLCARPDWDFLLRSRLDILSFGRQVSRKPRPLGRGPCLPAPVPTEGGAGRKGHNIKGNYLPGKRRPLGWEASLFQLWSRDRELRIPEGVFGQRGRGLLGNRSHLHRTPGTGDSRFFDGLAGKIMGRPCSKGDS